jgi:hypothetical protein
MQLTIKEYKQKLTDEFFKRIERKTGWGKEELKNEFRDASESVLLEMYEAIED